MINLNLILTGIGKRKTAIVKIYLIKNFGKFKIYDKLNFFNKINIIDKYNFILKPFIILNLLNQYNIIIYHKGGGITAKLFAIRFAISKALSKLNLNYSSILKKYLLLKYDSRIKERRKYGLKKARKAPQYSKR